MGGRGFSTDFSTEQGSALPVGLAALAADLRMQARASGLAAIGFAPATPMTTARQVLEERKAAGLAAGMQFTYRDPARSTEPARLLPGAAALVVGAWPYGDGPVPGDTEPASLASGTRPMGLVSRYARRDHYGDLRGALGALADVLGRAGWRSRVVVDDNGLVDRAAAQRAGLGWFGKNTNILLPGLGSWFLLGSVVTDAPLPPAVPQEDGCGTCRRCLKSCPTGALLPAGTLDARRCLAWLLQAKGVFPFEYRAALGARIYGCDDCQEQCPANRTLSKVAQGGYRARRDRAGAVMESAAGETVDILDMLNAPAPALLARFGRWYVPERDPRYLRRNALLVLANVGDGFAPTVEEVLVEYLSAPDELLRAHAVWAAARLGRRDLLARVVGLANDGSPIVQEELRRLHEVPAR